MKCIAIDLGTSFIKSALIDVSALGEFNNCDCGCLGIDDRTVVTRIRQIRCAPRKEDPDPFHYEIPADTLFSEVQTIINEYLKEDSSINGIVFSTQMHGFVLSGVLRADDTYVSWQDTRCLKKMPGTETSYLEYLGTLLSEDDMAPTGVMLKPALGLCNLYALLDERCIVEREGLTVSTLGSYIIDRLCGKNITHITNAAPLGFVDLHSRAWSLSLLEKVGLYGIVLPNIVVDMSPVGEYCYGERRVSLFPDIGDLQAAVLGCNIEQGEILVNVGTAAQLAMVETEFIPGDYEVRPYFEGLYLNTVSRMPGGRNLDVLVSLFVEVGREIFGDPDGTSKVWNYLTCCRNETDTRGLRIDVGFYELPDRFADGSIRHIVKDNLTVRTVYAAALRDMARVYAQYGAILNHARAYRGRFVFAGGVAWNNPMLLEAVTAETGNEVALAPMKDEVFVGLARAVASVIGA